MRIVKVALDVPLPGTFDYLCPMASEEEIGRVVEVPFGARVLRGLVVGLSDSTELAADKIKAAGPIEKSFPALPPDWLALVDFCSRYYQAPIGKVVAMALPPVLRRVGKRVSARADEPWLALTEAGASQLLGLARNTRARQVLAHLQQAGPQSGSDLCKAHQLAPAKLRALVDKNWVVARPPVARVPDPPAAQPGPVLKPSQEAAIERIAQSLGCYGAYLLHGVTGSGKTEVYLQLIARVLARGGQALMLVPEIALTPQLEKRVAARFPQARVVSLHSGQSDGARSEGFLEALSGRAHIVLGTRLAVFTPLPALGLIVVDEEHDPSFKQQDGVRYSARDLAVWRAHQRKVPVVLGSATPSLESWHHAQSGRYQRQSLPERAAALQMPLTRLIDTRQIRLDNGLSPQLFTAIEARLARGEQSLVFLNRRGYAPVLACAACGWVSQCPACSANRVLHLSDRRLRCHHCGSSAPVPPACPVCGNQDIQGFGRGTQRIEAFLQARYPQATVLRADRDAARTHTQWQQMLDQIQEGRADILVGTQMLAKGHDFPRLTLVAVLNADASLHASDCRAPERLFAQLMQVGGRSGRGVLPGEVLVQTEYPHHPLYQALVDHDYPRFAQSQLDERRAAGFPPFTFQAVLRAEAPKMMEALGFLQDARAAAASIGVEGVNLFDAVPMRLARRAGLERAQCLVESVSRAALQGFLSQWHQELYRQKLPPRLCWHLEVDPVEW
jgi:primosomal protein N' (replication factor Y)